MNGFSEKIKVMRRRTFRILAAVLGLFSLFVAFAPAYASELAQCLERELLFLNESALISQNDPSLRLRGLIPDSGQSMLCGLTCGNHLMEALRKSLKIPSIHSSHADEIQALAKFGGPNVSKEGISMENLRAALVDDLQKHGISANVDGLSYSASSEYIKKVSQLRASDLETPPGVAQATIVGIADRGGGHMLLLQHYLSDLKTAILVDPQNPKEPIMVFLEEDFRNKILRIVSPLDPGKSSPINAILRVRLDPSQKPAR